jgi:hypothetical protein
MGSGPLESDRQFEAFIVNCALDCVEGQEVVAGYPDAVDFVSRAWEEDRQREASE